MLAHELRAAAAQNGTQNDGHDDRVTELPGDRDEIRHEINRQDEIADEQGEQHLASPRDTRIVQQATHKDDAIRDEPRQRPSAFTATSTTTSAMTNAA